MAWTFEDKFNSDTKSTGELVGQDGWTGTTGKYSVTNSVSYEGDQCVTGTSTNDYAYSPSFTAVTAGTFYAAIRKETTNRDAGWRLWNGSSQVMLTIGMQDTSLYISYSSTDTPATFTTGTWYVYEIEIVSSTQFKYRYHDGTSWSTQTAAKNFAATGGATRISTVMGSPNAPATGVAYFDCVSPTDPTVVASTFIPLIMTT